MIKFVKTTPEKLISMIRYDINKSLMNEMFNTPNTTIQGGFKQIEEKYNCKLECNWGNMVIKVNISPIIKKIENKITISKIND